MTYFRIQFEKEEFSYYAISTWGYNDTHIRKDIHVDVYTNMGLNLYEDVEHIDFRVGAGIFTISNNGNYFAIIPKSNVFIKLQHSFSKPKILGEWNVLK